MIKKILAGVVIFIVLLVVVLLAGKDIIAQKAVTVAVKAITGLKMEIAEMKVGIRPSLIGIKELKLFNPAGFTDPVMIDLPEIYVEYDLPAILKKNIHLPEVRVHLKEFTVVKNKDGVLNLDSLKAVQSAKAEDQETEQKPPQEKGEAAQIQIDVMKLKIDTVYFKDYTQGKEPRVKTYRINIDEEYKNITDPQSVGRIIVVKALTNTTIANLTDLGNLTDTLSGTLKDVGGLAVGTVGNVTELGKDLSGKTLNEAGAVVEKTTDTIKNILPFGKKSE